MSKTKLLLLSGVSVLVIAASLAATPLMAQGRVNGMPGVFSTAMIAPNQPHVRPEQVSAMFYLPAVELAPLVLVVVRQHDYAQAAAILHTNEQTIQSNVNRARAHLKELIVSGRIATPDQMLSWKQDSFVLTQGEPKKEIERGLAIIYAISAGNWIRMDFFNGGLLTGLATPDWTWEKDGGFK